MRRAAAARGLSVSAFISQTLKDVLRRPEPSEQLPFELITVRGVRPLPQVNPDRPRALDARDDETVSCPAVSDLPLLPPDTDRHEYET
ncbi:MAG: hypothetical protein J4G00_04350 [Actinomycetia bacterium]|nr:hypothetical protein [Actinomycetes bacterium]